MNTENNVETIKYLPQLKITWGPGYGKEREEEATVAFPDWNKEDYLNFVREWKEVYKIHSQVSRLEKRDRKTKYNLITPEEMEKLKVLQTHPSFKVEGWFNTSRWMSMKSRARILLRARKLGKEWSRERRKERLESIPKEQANLKAA